MSNHPEQLYHLLQSIEGIVWEADTDMRRFTSMTGLVEPILGCTSEHCLLHHNFWEKHIHPEDHAALSDYRRLSLTPGKISTLEYRVVRPDGQLVWIRDYAGVYEQDGKVLLRGLMQDQTPAKRLSALEHLDGEILRIYQNLDLNLDELLLRYLGGLEALFPGMRCSFHRIRNGRLSSALSPSLPPDYMRAIMGLAIGKREGSCGAAAATARQVIVGNIGTHPNWRKYCQVANVHGLQACWSNPVIDSHSRVMATLAMYYKEPKLPSTEEMKVMERATALLRILLENREQAETIRDAHLLMLQSQELAHFGNWRWDVQQDVVTWSPALYTIYGLDQSFKATFAAYQGRLHPDDRLRAYLKIEQVLRMGGETSFEERIVRPGGEIRHLRSWIRLKKDEQGQPFEMIGACLDVTERINQQKTIQARDRELEQISEQQSQLLQTLNALEESHADNSRILKVVSHDLRHPIGAAKMAGAVLLLKKDRPEKELRMLDIIQRSTTSALELADELLNTQGKAEPLYKKLFNLGAMLHHCADLLRHQAEAKSQQITLNVVPAMITASRQKLWRVVSNLIANAIKFSHEGGVIEVRMRASTSGVIIGIKDNGIGIPSEIQSKLFSPAPDAQRTGTAGEPSFGMGLTISKQIVEAHNGRIWVESEEGAGSTFFVELPDARVIHA